MDMVLWNLKHFSSLFQSKTSEFLLNRCCTQGTPHNIHLKYHLLVITIQL